MYRPRTRDLTLAVLAVALWAGPPLEGQRRGGATLFADDDYRGRQQTFFEDTPDLRSAGLDRRASSIRIDRGCRVRLYGDVGFRGPWAELDQDSPSLRRTSVGNDSARSLKVRCGWDVDWGDRDGSRPGYGSEGGRPGHGSGGSGAVPRDVQAGSIQLYEQAGFAGLVVDFRGDVADLGDTRFGNDRAVAVRVARGCRVRLYADAGYRGAVVELNGDVADLGTTGLGRRRASSLKVRCGWDLDWDDDEPGDGYGHDPEGPGSGGHGSGRPGRGAAIVLFGDAGFRGVSEGFDDDVPDLRNSRIGHDRASSVRVGRRCRVRLYEDIGFRGRWVELDGDEPDLGQTRLGSDRASALKVRCGRWADWGDDDHGYGGHGGHGDDSDSYGGGGGYGGGRPGGHGGYRGVTLFRDREFRGEAEIFHADVSDLRGSRIGNDAASSILVDRGCRVRLFRDRDFRGPSIEIGHDEHDLGDTPVGNDAVSSLAIRCGRHRDWGGGHYRGVTLYQHADYRGDSEAFGGDVIDLRDTLIGNDEASSIRVDPGCRVELFADAGFRGQSITIDRDERSLGRTPFGNDRVSSLRVRCY